MKVAIPAEADSEPRVAATRESGLKAKQLKPGFSPASVTSSLPVSAS